MKFTDYKYEHMDIEALQEQLKAICSKLLTIRILIIPQWKCISSVLQQVLLLLSVRTVSMYRLQIWL